jgi:RNA polymerase sigma-70 factor (ECF subfamily)
MGLKGLREAAEKAILHNLVAYSQDARRGRAWRIDRPSGRRLRPGKGTVFPSAGTPQPESLERLRLGLQIMALHTLGDWDVAEEVAQETLVRALEVLCGSRPTPPENLGAFVRGIARHVIADTCYARRRSIPLEDMPYKKGGANTQDPLSLLVTEEERGRVRGALLELSPADRDLLHLAFFEGLTPSEIAERIDEPAARIRKRKSRALHRLREAFSGEDGTGNESRPPGTGGKRGRGTESTRARRRDRVGR